MNKFGLISTLLLLVLTAASAAPPSRLQDTRPQPLSSWPTLTWPDFEGDIFAVMILPASGQDSVLWVDRVEGRAFVYPANAPALPSGLYRYRIAPLDSKGINTGQTLEGTFTVAVGASRTDAIPNPLQDPQHSDTLILDETNVVHEIDASGRNLVINCAGSVINVSGNPFSLVVNGSSNVLNLAGSASAIRVDGSSNIVNYAQGAPVVTNNGQANVIQKQLQAPFD